MSNNIKIMPDGQLRESIDMASRRRSRIGTKEISGKRAAAIEDTIAQDGSKDSKAWDAYLNGDLIDKEGLDDSDLQDVAVARLDEKILELGMSDMDSSQMLKIYEELSGAKELIRSIEISQKGDSLLQAVHNIGADSKENGDTHRAEIADVAYGLLNEISLEALDLLGGSEGDDARNATKRVIDQHNQRVVANREAFAIGEERHRAAIGL